MPVRLGKLVVNPVMLTSSVPPAALTTMEVKVARLDTVTGKDVAAPPFRL
jgi:hypothetical protein